ncbi:hypothetical protein AAF712_011641 [Marasmius tenuissimus]|uniref:Uncharacterized protein n=1 Tax=Marasmius tenuissimus TaxID=585030 RepID=A0ABR2ZJJ0_9AGAR
MSNGTQASFQSPRTLTLEQSSDGVVVTPPPPAAELPASAPSNALQMSGVEAANSANSSVSSLPHLEEQPASPEVSHNNPQPLEEKPAPAASGDRGEPIDENLASLIRAEHIAANKGWRNQYGSWGDREYQKAEDGWGNAVSSPKIVSLTSGRSWTDTGDDAVFRWRTKGSSGKPSHRHIILYARHDLGASLNPMGDRKPLAMSEATSDKWARTLVIQSLPEARYAGIPPPDFTLAEVLGRLAEVDSDVATAKQTVADNLSRIEKIRAEQEPLRATLRALDNERSALLRDNEEAEKTLQELADVQADLKDLESLALAFC